MYPGSFLSELPRIPIPRTGVKIAFAAALFHGFGVARQGPWLTWVNKGKERTGAYLFVGPGLVPDLVGVRHAGSYAVLYEVSVSIC